MHQAIIVELPELMGLINESPEKVKAFLSKSFDTIRNLFAKKAIKKDRGFIFVGTTNSDQYLAASMGVRRFWPIRIPSHVKEINIAGVKRDREQLFAEAIAMYRDGYPYWNMPQGTLEKVVSKRFVEEPLSDVIKEMIPTLGFRWSIQDIYKRLELGGFIPKGLTMQVVKRIDTALKAIGCYKNADGIWSPPVPQEPIKMLDELL
jgi:hypothetical protein